MEYYETFECALNYQLLFHMFYVLFHAQMWSQTQEGNTQDIQEASIIDGWMGGI